MAVRNYTPVLYFIKLIYGHPFNPCPETTDFEHLKIRNGSPSIRLSKPIYDASLSATPGLRASLFIGYWKFSIKKNIDYWIDERKIESSNFHFETHENTNKGYKVNANRDNIAISAF